MMPELPEVETIRKSLQSAIVGKTIKDIEVRKTKIFKGNPKEIIGEKIEGIERKGKVLIIKLSSNKSLLVHFKLTGQMVWVGDRDRVRPARQQPEPARFALRSKTGGPQAMAGGDRVILEHPIPFAGTELPAKTTHVIFTINGGKLFYNDLRQFGWIKIISDLSNLSDLGKLGPEPFDKEFTAEYLRQIFSKISKPIKLVLMDQEKIAGIGNIYANEALFEAGIGPAKPAKQLGNEAIEKLRGAIIKVLEEGLKYGGSSAKDESYIKPTGEPGEYQKHFRVYQRDGEKCIKCGGVIKRIELGGRGTFYCEECQK